MSLVHYTRAPGHRLDSGLRQRGARTPLTIPAWPTPAPMTVPRHARARRSRAVRVLALLISVSPALPLVVAPVLYELGV